VAFVFEEFVRNYAMALFRALEKKTDEEDTWRRILELTRRNIEEDLAKYLGSSLRGP
jgi:hypothetical protein